MNFRCRTRRAPYLAITLAATALSGLAPLAMPATALAVIPAAASPIGGYVFSEIDQVNPYFAYKAAVYQPAVQYDSTKGAKITVAHLATGDYDVLAAGSSGNAAKFGGNVQVNAVGSRGRHCSVLDWDQQLTPSLKVVCVDIHGHPADSPFTVEWVVP